MSVHSVGHVDEGQLVRSEDLQPRKVVGVIVQEYLLFSNILLQQVELLEEVDLLVKLHASERRIGLSGVSQVGSVKFH